jgi:hypothetical protein
MKINPPIGIFYVLSIFLFHGSAVAQGGFWDRLLGGSSYEDCILQNMRGVTSDQAAAQIARACRNRSESQGPSQPPSVDVMREFPNLRGMITEGAAYQDADMFFFINHQNENILITSIRIKFTPPSSAGVIVQCYPHGPILAYHNQRISCPYRPRGNVITAVDIVQIIGYRRR